MKTIHLSILFTVLVIGGCSSGQIVLRPRTESQPIVRVAVLRQADQFRLNVKGDYRIQDKQHRILERGNTLTNVPVTAQEAGIRVGGKTFKTDYIRITPLVPGAIYVNERQFRGELDVALSDDNQLTVINRLGLEDYVKGVLYHEISNRWPMEAIKAQAVAVRTYALYKMEWNKNRLYDLTNDIYSQVYGGRTSEKYRTNLGTEWTRGLILVYEGKIFPSYYHADSGGHTEDVSELWSENWPPLQGVADPYSEQSPHHHWKRNFQSSQVQEKLNQAGYDLWLIKTIEVLERNPSGRIRTLRITDRKGKSIDISGKEFRQLIGPNIIRSNNYQVQMKGYFFDLIGKGWGHGVGLSQWGANLMSRQGHDFEEILEFYYPGTEIVHYETLGF